MPLAKSAKKPNPNLQICVFFFLPSPLPPLSSSCLSELDLKHAENISVPDLLKVSIIDW